jgi:predicted metal-dependent HD superfamily phosphohydrolase
MTTSKDTPAARRARLHAAWLRTLSGARVRSGAEELFASLLAAYEGAGRHYHTTAHLDHCFSVLESEFAQVSPEVPLALWFHDVVYDPRRKDNEAASAELAAHHVQHTLDLSAAVADRVAELVLATAHGAAEPAADAPPSREVAIVTDVDLAIFGAEPSEFDRYEAAIRAEFEFVPEVVFAIGRSLILKRFLERPRIFNTRELGESLLEARARSNLMRSVEQLASILE